MCFYGPAETTRTSRSLRGTASTKHPVPLSINQVAMLASLTRVASRPSCGLIRRAANATSVAIQKNVRHSSKLSQVLRAELEEERQVQYDEGEIPWYLQLLTYLIDHRKVLPIGLEHFRRHRFPIWDVCGGEATRSKALSGPHHTNSIIATGVTALHGWCT